MTPKFIQLVIDGGGILWALDDGGIIWTWNGSTWVQHSHRPA